MSFFEYVAENYQQILGYLLEHIQLTAIAIGLAIVIGVPLGILIGYAKKVNKPVLGIANVIQAIPSMALLGFAIPILGIGYKPAIIVVVLYSLLPIIKNTFTGLESINPETLEAAQGIGLTKSQILFKIRLPLALPMIMAGVRISAVTAVGLMTMAAFIGGGGLGYLIFSGIRTVNNYQILAGAIPACLLALGIDFIGSVIEEMVTPKSLLPQKTAFSKKRRTSQKVLLGMVAGLLAVAFILPVVQGSDVYDKKISIGSKDYTEQEILCHLVSEAIEENTDIHVERRPALGGTQVCFGALKAGEIDAYVEYSGTAYGDILQHPAISDVEEVYDTVKQEFFEQFDIKVLQQMQFNNTYTLAVRQDTAMQYQLETISDLTKVSKDLVASPCLEFLNRQDGLPGLEKAYGLYFSDVKGLDGSPRYTALMNYESDVVDAFATDGLLKKFDLVVLRDDKQFFPSYYAMPLIRAEILERYPEIEPVINQMGALLDDQTMIELNYKVDELQMEPRAVAREFLIQNGMIKE